MSPLWTEGVLQDGLIEGHLPVWLLQGVLYELEGSCSARMDSKALSGHRPIRIADPQKKKSREVNMDGGACMACKHRTTVYWHTIMFNFAVDECGKTYNATELVKNKSETEIGNARKRKYLCMTCVDGKHAVSLNVRREVKHINKKPRNNIALAWFSHHGGGGGGISKKYPNEACSETVTHCHAKHILCENVGRYQFETLKCMGCTRHTKIESGSGACSRVEYTEKTADGIVYRYDAVLMRGDADNMVIHSVLEVWATHETSKQKREYCLEMGYTFAEFHAPHVVEEYEKALPGSTFKLENLKIRIFECQQCKHMRELNEIRLEKERLLQVAVEEHKQQLKAAADERLENARLREVAAWEHDQRLKADAYEQEKHLERTTQRRERVDEQFYATSPGAETRIIELQETLCYTYMYTAWISTNCTRDSDLSPHQLHYNGHYITSHENLANDTVYRLASVRDPLAWCAWHVNAAKQEARARMFEIKKGTLKLNFAKYEKGVSFKCVCAKWAREDKSMPRCRRIYRRNIHDSSFDEIVHVYNLWEFNRNPMSSWCQTYAGDPFIKVCGLCCTACVFCGNDLLLSTVAEEGQCGYCHRHLLAHVEKMKISSPLYIHATVITLHYQIDDVYCGDAFRGFFDYAIEHRVRMQAEKIRMLQEQEHQLHIQRMWQEQQPKRKTTRVENIRDILKAKPQTNTLMHHFNKTAVTKKQNAGLP